MTTIAAANIGTRGTMFIDDDGTYIRFYLSQGDTATFIGSPGKPWSGVVNGVGVGGNFTWPSGGGTRLIAGPWAVGSNQTVSFTVGATGTQGFGNGGTIYGAVNRATVPPPPNWVAGVPNQITATSMRLQFSWAGDGGSPIQRYEYMYSTTPNFSSGNSPVLVGPNNGIFVQGDLQPTTQYWWAVRAVNGVGTGGWSTFISGTTLATTAPGILPTPALNGQSATVTLTPPPTMPSPDSYKLEYRLQGTTNATALVSNGSTVVAPLTPGATYEYRAAAVNGTVTGPYTAWTPLTQPSPNVSPGDFFDGNTPSKPDILYVWSGAANNSTTIAMGHFVTGWTTFNAGNAVSGGTGSVYRVTGGRTGGFAARVDFWSPTNVPGYHAGTSWVDGSGFVVAGGGMYNALIHVRLPFRSQRLAAVIIWVDAANVEVGRAVGTDVLVASSATEWTPLRVSATPPLAAVRGAVRVIDVAGAGWSAWQSGDSMLLDDAITPFADYYFDGNTPDTATTQFVWDGTANASPSRALPSTVPPVNPLLDPDCPPIPAPPRPPVIDDSCVEEDVIEWRRFFQEIPQGYIHSWLDSVPILQIETHTTARLVRVRYYPNPFNRPLSELETDSFCSEQIISFIPSDTIFTLDGTSQRAYAEVNDSSVALAADSLLRGDTTQWPTLGCGIPYFVTVDVPSDTPVNALSLRYSLVHRY